jgi:hypothetical protein
VLGGRGFWIFHFQPGQSLQHNPRNDQPRILLVIRGNDVPG